MYAEIVINIEAPLSGTFHYHVPSDLERVLQVGHLVEVEFGRRLAQGIIIAFSQTSPIPETKPIIAKVEAEPVVTQWQIDLSNWLSENYMAPLNNCLRLMLPPGLTRWADITLDINPGWEGDGRLTEKQTELLAVLEQKGNLRGRQLTKQFGKKAKWQPVVEQLVRRNIIRRGSILDPPRSRPKNVRLVDLTAGYERQLAAVSELGRSSKKADILIHLAHSNDPLVEESKLLEATGANKRHLQSLLEEGTIWRSPKEIILIATPANKQPDRDTARYLHQLPSPLKEFDGPAQDLIKADFARFEEQPASIGLNIDRAEQLRTILEQKKGLVYFDILDLLKQAGQALPISEIYASTGANLNHLKKLQNLDLIRLRAEEVWRDPLADRDFVPSEAPELTADQVNVWDALQRMMRSGSTPPKPVLLHGVTGSGKTEIYMRAVETALQFGQQAIVLVPEIALTPQTVRRFASRFPGRVAVMHSRLSDGERYDTWRRAKQGLFDIVIGPRSALFTPFNNIGVIVVDEEHDASYKHSPPVPPPYYHARETAIEIGRRTGAIIILGSATPDVVTYHRALSGHFELLELPKRVMGHRKRLQSQEKRLQRNSHYAHLSGAPDDALTIPLPPVQLVDLRQELRVGNRSIFSRVLVDALDKTLERSEQAILFMNRRGTASFIICRDCGHLIHCPRCDLPLTYHRPKMALVCHQCGYNELPHETCPICSSKRIRHFGLGTEEIEFQVQQRWPAARITRWDRDTTAGKDMHEALLSRFINQESDILIGTQMIAKGLDLPLVTLVGVISADVALGLPDFRTGERAFQILAQVAGRAGRGLLGGRVIVQTYQPQHYAIRTAAEHDFNAFFVEEMSFRTQHMLPPFRRMAKLELADPVATRAKYQAEQLAATLRQAVRELGFGATDVFGPVPPYFSRIDGRYRWQITLRSPDLYPLLKEVPIPKPWIVDIDPVSTL
jgi:primosomal protein N' (replication factor Y) (superfamily II helicase)